MARVYLAGNFVGRVGTVLYITRVDLVCMTLRPCDALRDRSYGNDISEYGGQGAWRLRVVQVACHDICGTAGELKRTLL